MKVTHYFLLVVMCVVFPLQAQQTYLHCGHIFDAKKGKLKAKQTLIVEGTSIGVNFFLMIGRQNFPVKAHMEILLSL